MTPTAAAFPADIGVIDLMIGFPHTDAAAVYYARHGAKLKDASSQAMEFPAQYMFTDDVPRTHADDIDPIAATLAAMDAHGVAVGLVGIGGTGSRAIAEHPDRFIGALEVDPNDITGSVLAVREAHDTHAIKAVTSFPAGCTPAVPISDRRYYPVYQTCIDLDLPILVNAGVAGPRYPSVEVQHVAHFDQVCYDFPDLRIVMRHGAEPWADLAVKLMLKWPGLFYMTSAFAPRYYPSAIIDYANTRGADKIMYAGYHPMGLTLDRIFAELPSVPFRSHVWPKFLRHNAESVFKL